MKQGSRIALLASFVALAACEPDVEPTSGTGTTPLDRGQVEDSRELVQPVVVGEFGPRFDACTATGLVRSVSGDGVLAVRAAPFDRAQQTGTVANGFRVYVCNRSIDQEWLGVVYQEGGALSQSCGVSAPVAMRRRYEGPCESGWISSAFVQLRGREPGQSSSATSSEPAPGSEPGR